MSLIYSLDISTDGGRADGPKGMPPPPPPIPATAQHMPAGGRASRRPPSTRTITTGNYIPVFVDIFKAVKSVFVDDTLDVFTRFTGGKRILVHQRPEPGTGRSPGIGEELHSQYLLSYVPE